MRCGYFEDGRCRSCSHLRTPYQQQLDTKAEHARAVLADCGGLRWLPPVPSRPSGFRNKAKMVVAGTVDAPTLGILDPGGDGTDLRACGLYSPAMQAFLPEVAAFITTAGLTPYDVSLRRGELKHVLVTESPSGEYLVRFVLRSTESMPRLRKHLPGFLEANPAAVVVSANLQPQHKAVLEGPEEIVLTEQTTLPVTVNDVDLHLGARSFFQTNTDVAAALYRQAREWADGLEPRQVLDLYCGVGGFALHLAAPGRRVLGVELSEQAVHSARATAHEQGLLDVEFAAGDATDPSQVTGGSGAQAAAADLVVVNPPRRGLGPELCAWIEASAAQALIYSSCRVETLARDLAALPAFRAEQARLLDMFPHTDHYEVIVLLRRQVPQ